jgi:sugar lactone lactonase YvrE
MVNVRRTDDLELLVPPCAELAEGPCWDPIRQELLWVDIPAGIVHRLGDGGHTRVDLGRPVGAVVPIDGTYLAVCCQGEITMLDRDSGVCERLHPLEPDRADLRPNDAKCDPAGRLWVGTTRFAHDEPAGTLYRVAGNRPPAPVLGGLWCSNGLGWSPDGTAMYFADSLTHRIDRFRFSAEDGKIRNRMPLIDIDPGDGIPDGMSVDADGGIWVALWDGACLRRYTQEGELSAQIDLPTARVTSCCFGGPSWTDLFITTAAANEPDGLGGGIFRARPGVAGMPTKPFALAWP